VGTTTCGAWRLDAFARRSATEFCLAALERRQVIMQGHNICMNWMCMVYKALGDTLMMDLLKRTLSCGSEWYPLSRGSR